MKKFFFALAAVVALAFVGCSDDDKDDAKSENGLVGTTWEYYESNESGGYLHDTFAFKKNGNVTWTESWLEFGDQGTDVINGTYTYSEPNLSMKFTDDEGDTYRFIGTVEGNSIRLYEDGDYYGTLTKK
ncbi:MAG: hypothetical protein NC250_06050 [Alistipes senegalensis]|nr:hypothetical protein [Bacteroides cellulosilyticus]MCM1352276.1 hypothetical protein [Alistipes senegalensis]